MGVALEGPSPPSFHLFFFSNITPPCSLQVLLVESSLACYLFIMIIIMRLKKRFKACVTIPGAASDGLERERGMN